MNMTNLKPQHMLVALAIDNGGDFKKITDAIRNHVMPSEEAYAKAEKIHERGNAITILDDAYPKAFKQLYMPPIVLFCEGNKSLLAERGKVAFLGRNAEKGYDKRNARKLASYVLDEGQTAIFKDNALTREALYGIKEGKVILVCPFGLSGNNLGKVLRMGGLAISEVPYDATPTKECAVWGNRLAANICDKAIVLECGRRSSTLLAVKYALNAGKDIGCVPHSLDEEDDVCNDLIREGACLIRNGQDILDM